METREIEKYLQENGVYGDFNENLDGTISIHIEYGDWKHDHAYCDYLMKEKGWQLIREQETWEDGSDCYSSIHTYMKITLENLLKMRKLFANKK